MSEVADDLKWKELISLGNNAFCEGQHFTADRSFNAALSQAQRLFALSRDGLGIDGPFVLLITYQNLAHNCLRMARIDDAEAHLTAAFDALLDGITQLSDNTKFKNNCQQHIGTALEERVKLKEQRGQGDEAAILISRTQPYL